jgi:hypothetical protein
VEGVAKETGNGDLSSSLGAVSSDILVHGVDFSLYGRHLPVRSTAIEVNENTVSVQIFENCSSPRNGSIFCRHCCNVEMSSSYAYAYMDNARTCFG